MSLLDIRVLGDPVLRQDTTPVTTITDDVRQLVADMFDTMYAAEGIGLAAPQVGRTERIAVIDVHGVKYALVNPEIVLAEGRAKAEEGCLSIPEIYGEVERATRVVVRALDLEEQPFDLEATELLARCILHEVDHLHGRLFIDYFGPIRRRTAMSKWNREREKYPGNLRRLDPREIARHHEPGDDETL